MRNRHPQKEYKRLYEIYHGIKKRCYNKNCDRYKDYGGRGIVMCDEWLESVDNFIDWALENGYSDDLTIDRKDNDGNYCPENCKWSTYKEQAQNTRRTIYVTYKGVEKSLSEWCDILGLKYDPMHNRITNGWDAETAFETPLSTEKPSFSAMCRKNGINMQTAYDRIHKLGWDIERALKTPSVGLGANQKTYGG